MLTAYKTEILLSLIFLEMGLILRLLLYLRMNLRKSIEGHYLCFMFSPQKIHLSLFTILYVTQPSNKLIIFLYLKNEVVHYLVVF